MSTAIDVACCIDYTSSMGPDFGQIRQKINRILDIVFTNNQNGSRVSLIKFRSDNDYPVIITNAFTQHRNTFVQWINNDQPQGGSTDGYEAIGPALQAVLNLNWRNNNNNAVLREKLAILITDGAPSGLFSRLIGKDPWVLSNRFREQGITLVVVGVGRSIVDCDDFYCALAKNTGGAYIPLVNADRILSSVIRSVINEEDTIRQALLHIIREEIERNSLFKYSYIESRVSGMINECQTMADIRDIFYNHRRFN